MTQFHQFRGYIRFLFSVLKIGLGFRCDLGDSCLDQHASCADGACRCDDTHFNDNGICGEWGTVVFPVRLAQSDLELVPKVSECTEYV